MRLGIPRLDLFRRNEQSAALRIAPISGSPERPHHAHKRPLCFHILTHTFSHNSFLLTSIQKHRGCHPQLAKSSRINNFSSCLDVLARPAARYNARFTPKATLQTGWGSYWVWYGGCELFTLSVAEGYLQPALKEGVQK